MKKISVIIPAFNCEKYIERCISSLLCQKGAELEIIAVNDGSTDKTLEKLLKYEEKITVLSIKNSGAAGARNAGLSCASGDFLMFIDADDYLKDDAVLRIAKVQSENDADIVHFRYEWVNDGGSFFVPECQIKEDMFVKKEDFPNKIYPMFFNGIFLNSVCMSVYRRSVIKDITFRTDMKTAEDAVFSLEAFTNAKSVRFIPDIIYEYYQSNEGLTGKGASVFRKYRDNFTFAAETAKRLKIWGMDNPINYARVFLRPVIVTLDKTGRIIRGKR